MIRNAKADTALYVRGTCRVRPARVLDRALRKQGTYADGAVGEGCGDSWYVVGNHGRSMSLGMVPVADQAGDANFLDTVFSIVRASELRYRAGEKKRGQGDEQTDSGGGHETDCVENAGIESPGKLQIESEDGGTQNHRCSHTNRSSVGASARALNPLNREKRGSAPSKSGPEAAPRSSLRTPGRRTRSAGRRAIGGTQR